MPKFKVTDSSLNAYGFRILTEGIDWSLFDKNPLMLWMHQRAFSKDDPLPLGTWTDREVKGDAVLMDPKFDENDDFAIKIKDKVDQGIINMTSISVDILETSIDAKYLLPGQTRETVTKCLAKEISFVDIGGNRNAIRLFRNGIEVKLAEGEDNNDLPLIKIKTYDMKAIALKLGLPESATEDQILAKIAELSGKVTALESSNTELTTSLKRVNDEKSAALVDGAIAEGKITADKKETFMKMANSDFEGAKAVLAAMPTTKKPSEMITPKTQEQGTSELSDFSKLVEQGQEAVEKLRSEDPEKYAKLYEKHYGFKPKMAKA